MEYRFFIRKGSATATQVAVFPIWKDDISLEYEKESGQMFHRAQLSGSIDLCRADYDKVMNESFGTVFFFEIEKSVDRGATWSRYWMGRFTLADCLVNVDNKKLTVKPTVYDVYTDILEGLEKEYDLIKLTPAMQRILIRKRPCLQLYDEGDEIISCIVGNLSFEQDVNVPDEDNVEDYLRNRCHFSVISSFAEFNFTDIASGYENDFALPFSGLLNGDGSIFRNTTDTYYLRYFEYRNSLPDYQYEYFNGIEIFRTGDQPIGANVKWRFKQSWIGPINSGYPALPEDITFESLVSGVANMEAVRNSNTVYGRIVCNVENFGTQATKELHTDDLVTYNRNYRRAIGQVVTIYESQRTSNDPTEWGRTDAGTYFLPPDDYYVYVPVGRSKWVNTSLWYRLDNDFINIETIGSYAYMLNDAYPIHSAISVLLNEIGSSVTFSNTTQYSSFLYSGDDAIGGRDNRLFITPKTNITAGEYQTPAQKGMITLKEIFEMLRDTYKCYWFVDANGRLRIEHVQWFMNGGSYSGSPSVGIDMTALTNKRNGKPWSYDTNMYQFEKSEMPERYQFGWMDDVTDLFMGTPINMISPYVEKGKVENIDVKAFTSDVDFMMLNPSGISQDGFALLNVEKANAVIGGQYYYTDGVDGQIFSVASYVWDKTCEIKIGIQGTGTLTLVRWYGDRAEDSSIVFSLPLGTNPVTVSLQMPEGVTGISFKASNYATVTMYSLTVQSDNDTVQLPIISVDINGIYRRMQNGNLSFWRLQDPYWFYDMPAKYIEVHGTTHNVKSVGSISRKKKQTISIPVGDTEPDMNQLVKTGLGDGQIQQASIRLTTRMAKTQLRYDTE